MARWGRNLAQEQRRRDFGQAVAVDLVPLIPCREGVSGLRSAWPCFRAARFGATTCVLALDGDLTVKGDPMPIGGAARCDYPG